MKNSIILRFIAVFCASFLLLTFTDLAIPNGEEAVYDSVIRLHILANSDSERDQALKLAVRDAIISSCRIDGADTAEEQADELCRTAQEVLAKSNADYSASAVFGREDYPTSEYDGITFPAGNYLSLRIILGNGDGHNWWCVLFPPLCLSAATAEEGLGRSGIDRRASRVYTDKKYIFRFRLLEWLFGT